MNFEDEREAAQARAELEAVVEEVAKELNSNRSELETTRHILVEVLPKALGTISGGVIGGLVAGPPGAIGGGLVGVIGEEALRPVQQRLFGWVLDRLPFHSARKLLTRIVNVDLATRTKLQQQLEIMWETDGH